jgi:hypothetical protein
MKTEAVQPAEAVYDQDFVRWTEMNARLIRSGHLTDADLEHVAEEIEDIGKSEKKAVFSNTRVLLQHLLKWKYQPLLRQGGTWLSTIIEQRNRLEDSFDDTPQSTQSSRTPL